MANVVMKTEEEQMVQSAHVTPPPPAPVTLMPVEAVETSTTAPVVSAFTAPLASASSSRRYDQATIEKALAVAMRMQQEHQATLSTEQVVRLGEEVNVDRAFMLRALAQLDGTAAATDETLSVAPLRQRQVAREALASEERQTLAPLPLLSKYIAVVTPLLFAVVSFCIFITPATRLDRSDNNFALLWMFLGGPLLALLLGVGMKRLRLGLLGGFCTGFFLLLAGLLASENPTSLPLSVFFVMLFLFTAAGSMLGVMGAALPRLYRRVVISLVRQFPHLAEAEEAR